VLVSVTALSSDVLVSVVTLSSDVLVSVAATSSDVLVLDEQLVVEVEEAIVKGKDANYEVLVVTFR
jgi:hypothetical protein